MLPATVVKCYLWLKSTLILRYPTHSGWLVQQAVSDVTSSECERRAAALLKNACFVFLWGERVQHFFVYAFSGLDLGLRIVCSYFFTFLV